MERMKAEQRRLKDDVNSVRTQSSTSKPSGDDYRSEERVARRAIPAEIFYGIPPRHTSLHPDPMTISELRTPTPADTPEPDEFRRNSSAGIANPLETRERPHISHLTTPVLQQYSRIHPSLMHQSSRLGNVRISRRLNVTVRIQESFSIQTMRHGVPYEMCSRYVRWIHYTVCHKYDTVRTATP